MSVEEQQVRFEELKQMFGTGSQSNYSEFWANAYKYGDEISIEGYDETKKNKLLEILRNFHQLLGQALTCFEEISKTGTTEANPTNRKLLIQQISHGPFGQFINQKDGSIDLGRALEALRWSLDTFDKSVGHIGRAEKITPEEQTALLEDIKYVIGVVNRYTHK